MGKGKNFLNFKSFSRQISKVLINLKGNKFLAGSFTISRLKWRSEIIQIECQSNVTHLDEDETFRDLKTKTNLLYGKLLRITESGNYIKCQIFVVNKTFLKIES